MAAWRSILLIFVAACSAPAQLKELKTAEQLERDGDVEGALAAYRAAQDRCERVSPKRRRLEVCGRALIGEAELKGTVKGTAVKFTVFATYQGKREDLMFSGEYDGSGAIKGSQSNSWGSGSFTATRK